MKQTQITKIFDFVKSRGTVTTWELEDFARTSKTCMSSSATRHARTLARLGYIKHPENDGLIDIHRYIYVKGMEQAVEQPKPLKIEQIDLL